MNHTLSSLLAIAETDEGKQQIRVMVAEKCGWLEMGFNCVGFFGWKIGNLDNEDASPVPDYHTSLDAIMPEVRKLPRESRDDYLDHLEAVCGTDGWQIMGLDERWSIATAEPVHHCITLLLTLQA